MHPLSEIHEASHDIPEDTMNTWAVASLVVDSAIQGNENGLAMLKDGLMTFNPLINFDAILAKIKSGDKSAIYQAINWVKEGIDIKCDQAFASQKED